MPGGGDFVSFFDPGAGVLNGKTVPGVGILTEKISGPGISPGGGDGNQSNWYLHKYQSIVLDLPVTASGKRTKNPGGGALP